MKTSKDEQPGKIADQKSVVYGALTATVFAITGGALIASGESAAGLGLTMFLFLPVATGFVTGFVGSYGKSVGSSLMIALMICLAGLVFTGLEGIVCVSMASPILIVGCMIGAGIGTTAKKYFSPKNNYSLAMVPLLAGASLFGAGKLEDQLAAPYRIEKVETTIVIDASPEDVWDAIMEFDEVTGPKPLLMKMGLPVPEKCSIDGTGVGAERVCHFSSGFIRERVTHWTKPEHLELDVIEVQLPGRHWLGFLKAAYHLEGIGNGQTKVTRTTTVTSTLHPDFYWRYFEHLGTQTEHDYILNSLQEKIALSGK